MRKCSLLQECSVTTMLDTSKAVGMSGSMRESVAYDRKTATSRPCDTCCEPMRFDYHYSHEPYQYRAYAICSKNHVVEF